PLAVRGPDGRRLGLPQGDRRRPQVRVERAGALPRAQLRHALDRRRGHRQPLDRLREPQRPDRGGDAGARPRRPGHPRAVPPPPLWRTPDPGGGVGCTLGAAAPPPRLAAWADVLRGVTARDELDADDGVRLRFDDDVDPAALAALAAAEQRCCAFLAFAI